jgi:5-methylcytosine-specific restriction enzyme subunit McrC
MEATAYQRVSLQEWQRAGPDELGRDVALADNRVRAAAEELTRSRRLEVLELHRGLEIRARSYVGRVRLGDLEVTVTPKVGGVTLVRLFRYAFRLRDLKLMESADYASTDRLLVDLLVAQLHGEARELFSRGLNRRYLRTEGLLASPRGRIDISALTRRAGQVEAGLPCIHHPRLQDNTLNRTLVAGLRLGGRAAGSSELRAACHRLASLMAEDVGSVPLTASLLLAARRSLNRLVAAYRPALTVIELLYEAQGLSLDAAAPESPARLPGFLFDMNRFFQALLSRFLRENLRGFELKDEYEILQMMRYLPHDNPRKRLSPRPRPDFAVISDRRLVALLDAKYRDLWEYKLPREMLYQLAIYALSQGEGARATILYPTVASAAPDQVLELSDPVVGKGRGFVVLRGVQLLELAQALAGDGEAERRRRAELARWMVFGATSVV